MDQSVANGSISINSNGSWIVKGAVYAPSAQVTLNSNASSECTQIIAKNFNLDSNATITLNHRCEGVGVSGVGGSFRLVH